MVVYWQSAIIAKVPQAGVRNESGSRACGTTREDRRGPDTTLEFEKIRFRRVRPRISALLRQHRSSRRSTVASGTGGAESDRNIPSQGYLNQVRHGATVLTKQATTGGASRTLSFSYDLHGNILSKTSNVAGDQNASGYTYNVSGKPHRLASVAISGTTNTLTYDLNGNTTRYTPTTGNSTYLTYSAQNNVTQITVGTSEHTSTPEARDRFWYDPDNQRFLGQETWNDNGTQRMRLVVYLGGDYEDVLPESDTPTAACSGFRRPRRRGRSGSATHRPARGTPRISSTSTAITSARWMRSPTAPGWCRRSSASTRSAGGGRALGRGNWRRRVLRRCCWQSLRGSRGFTNHEHLNRTGFIHMNGRVYDPRIGRFVSPDPVIPNPAFSQSYNRYSYVLNNPLSYTDPTGFNPFKKIKKAFKSVGKAIGKAFKSVGNFLKKHAVDIMILIIGTQCEACGAILMSARQQQRASAGGWKPNRGSGGGGGAPGIGGPMMLFAPTSGESPPLATRQARARAEIDEMITSGTLVLRRKGTDQEAMDQLALEVLSKVHGISVRHKVEIGAWIFEDGRGGLVIRSVEVGDEEIMPQLRRPPTPAGARGALHTHWNDKLFSDYDLTWVHNRENNPPGPRLPLYVSRGGSVYACDPGARSCNDRMLDSEDPRTRKGRLVGDLLP
jgi:RHS repeat-associated protein